MRKALERARKLTTLNVEIYEPFIYYPNLSEVPTFVVAKLNWTFEEALQRAKEIGMDIEALKRSWEYGKKKGWTSLDKATMSLNEYMKLREMYNQINENIPTYGGDWIDEDTNTLYVYVMTKEDAEKVKTIVAPFGINLVVLKGRYTFKDLMTWKWKLTQILGNGIQSLDADESKNRVEIEVFAGANLSNCIRRIEAFIERENIPRDAVTILLARTKLTADVLESRDSRFDPLIGGIQIQDEDGGLCTLGFVAIDEDENEVFVTASHCANETDDYYQPTEGSNNYVGFVVEDPSWPRWSDALEVYVISRGIDYEIYPNYDIVSYTHTWDQKKGQHICKSGITTGETCGEILEVCTTETIEGHGTLYCQMRANYVALPGDSGSPVFRKLSTPNAVSLYGTHVGGESYEIYSPISNIFNDLGWYERVTK